MNELLSRIDKKIFGFGKSYMSEWKSIEKDFRKYMYNFYAEEKFIPLLYFDIAEQLSLVNKYFGPSKKCANYVQKLEQLVFMAKGSKPIRFNLEVVDDE